MERDFMGLKVKVKQEIQEETHDPGTVYVCIFSLLFLSFFFLIRFKAEFHSKRKGRNLTEFVFTFGLNLIFRKKTLF